MTATASDLQDLRAVLDPLLHPSIHDVVGWSETGAVVQGGEETRADGAGQEG